MTKAAESGWKIRSRLIGWKGADILQEPSPETIISERGHHEMLEQRPSASFCAQACFCPHKPAKIHFHSNTMALNVEQLVMVSPQRQTVGFAKVTLEYQIACLGYKGQGSRGRAP